MTSLEAQDAFLADRSDLNAYRFIEALREHANRIYSAKFSGSLEEREDITSYVVDELFFWYSRHPGAKVKYFGGMLFKSMIRKEAKEIKKSLKYVEISELEESLHKEQPKRSEEFITELSKDDTLNAAQLLFVLLMLYRVKVYKTAIRYISDKTGRQYCRRHAVALRRVWSAYHEEKYGLKK